MRYIKINEKLLKAIEKQQSIVSRHFSTRLFIIYFFFLLGFLLAQHASWIVLTQTESINVVFAWVVGIFSGSSLAYFLRLICS